MVSWRWLQPGLHLKRWVLAICSGIVLLIVGAMALGVSFFGIQTSMPEGPIPLSPEGIGILLVFAGVILTFTGIYRLIRRIEKLLKSRHEVRGLAEIAWQHTRLEQGPRVVCLGGGTGMSTALAGLKDYTSSLTAVVSVADDGGSSGRLRLDFDMLPPGDIRNCLIALADAGPVMAELLQYRFEEGEFAGHSFGNLFIAVLAKIRGDFGLAIREANRILNVRGQVLPATLDKISLVATHPDGTKTTGQRHIATSGKPIEELSLKPQPGDAPPDVLEAIAAADIVLVGPGSLYTSVLPTLLDAQVVRAINDSRALVVFAVNVMGQPGETDDFPASRHLDALRRLVPELRLDAVVINAYRPSPARIEPLEAKGVRLTNYDRDRVAAFGARVVLRDVIDLDNPLRHDPEKLAAAVMEAYESRSA